MTTLARKTDPQTSVDVAFTWPLLPDRQRVVLRVLRVFGPMDDARLVAAYQQAARAAGHTAPQSESGIRTRRCELSRLGLVRDSGRRVRTMSGRQAVVWEAVA